MSSSFFAEGKILFSRCIIIIPSYFSKSKIGHFGNVDHDGKHIAESQQQVHCEIMNSLYVDLYAHNVIRLVVVGEC